MRIRGASKLNTHRSSILEMRRNGKTIEEIRKFLEGNGVAAGLATISDWLKRNCENPEPAGPPSGEPDLARRPQRSLGLLDGTSDVDHKSRISKILRIIWLPANEWDERKLELTIGAEGFGIPANRDGEPDFTAYARTLGRKRVRTYGDMDFFLLALWTKKVREVCKTPVPNVAAARRQSKFVLEVAAGIRDEMLAAF